MGDWLPFSVSSLPWPAILAAVVAEYLLILWVLG